MNSPPIFEPILVVGLGCSLGVWDFDPWPYASSCPGKFPWQALVLVVLLSLRGLTANTRLWPDQDEDGRALAGCTEDVIN